MSGIGRGASPPAQQSSLQELHRLELELLNVERHRTTIRYDSALRLYDFCADA